MALFRALSNPEIARRLDAAAAAYERLMASGAEKPVAPEPLPLRHRALQEAILEALESAGEGLRIREVQLRAEQRLGRPVSNHSVVASLSAAANNPKLPVVKVSPGRYRLLEAPV
jgi:hypothetical protein